MNRFAPAFDCLEDRRVLSLVGVPLEAPDSGETSLVAATDLQLSAEIYQSHALSG
jgi:hypothetical protein